MARNMLKTEKITANFKINIEIILGICYLNIDEL